MPKIIPIGNIEEKDNKINSLEGTILNADEKYPTAQAVKDYVAKYGGSGGGGTTNTIQLEVADGTDTTFSVASKDVVTIQYNILKAAGDVTVKYFVDGKHYDSETITSNNIEGVHSCDINAPAKGQSIVEVVATDENSNTSRLTYTIDVIFNSITSIV